VTSLAETLDYIEVAQRRIPPVATLNELTLKLTARKAFRTVYVILKLIEHLANN